jgi:alanine racemase
VRGVLEINLRFLSENIAKIKGVMPSNIRYFAVVKANAYGLGLEKMASFLGDRAHPLVDGLVVSDVQEALRVRSAHVDLPLLILCPMLDDEIDGLRQAKAIPLVSSIEELDRLQNFAKKWQFKQDIHIKIDTGMGRSGVWFREAEEIFVHMRKCDHLQVSGIATHFASVVADRDFTELQLSRFLEIVRRHGQSNWLIHASSGFGIHQFINGTNTVRIATLHYGIPSLEDDSLVKRLALKSIIRLSGFAMLIKNVPAGTGIGYGRTFFLERDTKIALLSLGYADGCPVTLANGGEVLIRGQRCRIIGNVSMDQMAIDVTHLPQVTVGDECVLIGRQGEEEITLREFVRKLKLPNWACICTLSDRIVRKYIP